ncbi:LlaJI family restriction endonuclease [Clostridium perfringens]|uniref:LlaJI family restriction endonuclease n=1 Tax=Clostridium perfringens TaxID=1502 RepID=UPI0018E425FE|nr:LlaJI family restriction endonuclease [Clostridium perfringens]MBI6076698.1 LlaJI family restriction endonuclease [Clostridium perfringens]MDK0913257.1 LlaJI family restriction endonuclease [Clostridium perfringens]MDK0950834.1 LlaJI family restriction endonuclease [Clostridium perfringens]
MFKYAIEEEWTTIEKLDISQAFFSNIQKNGYKLIERNSSRNDLFKFTYVGVLTFKEEILIVLPKYYDEKYYYNGLECIKNIIGVLKKIPRRIVEKYKDSLFISKDIDSKYVPEISIADYLIKDFVKNGNYIKETEELKLNSNGRIDWKRTISDTNPILSNRYPIYLDKYTIKKKDSINNDIYRVHEVVVNYLIKKYGELLGYKIRSSYNRKMQNELEKYIKNSKAVISIIIDELENVYNDRDINLLRSLKSFFSKSNKSSKDGISMYGTNSFNLVWEYMCSYVLENEYEDFKECIPTPMWKANETENEVTNSRNTLEPDVIKTYNRHLLLVDAKYYSIILNNKKVVGNPGSYDVVKQYIYEIAINRKYTNYIVKNIFIYPKDMNDNLNVFGEVRLDIFDLKPIKNIYISPRYLINLVLKNERLPQAEIEFLINS